MKENRLKTLLLFSLLTFYGCGSGGGSSSSFNESSDTPTFLSDNKITIPFNEIETFNFNVITNDANNVRYYLSGGDEENFIINPITGALTFNNLVTEDIKSTYQFTIIAEDTLGHREEQEMTITIQDIKELTKPIFIIGSSTVSYKQQSALEGWGEVLHEYMRNPSYVYNRARAGSVAGLYENDTEHRSYDLEGPKLSSGTFYHEDTNWEKTKYEITQTDTSRGGFLLIEFGGTEGHSLGEYSVQAYKENLKKYIDEAKELGITPVLITVPADRNLLNENYGRNATYLNAKRELANEESVLLLDLFEKSSTFYKNSSVEHLDYQFGHYVHRTDNGTWKSREAFPSNYSWIDRVHTESYGAKRVAGFIRDLACDASNTHSEAQTLCQEFDQEIEIEIPTIYSHADYADDPSDDKIDGWYVNDHDDSKLHLVEQVDDIQKNNKVIYLNGDYASNQLFFTHGSIYDNNEHSWSNHENKNIEFDINFDEVQIFIGVESSNGTRFLYYTNINDEPYKTTTLKFLLDKKSIGLEYHISRNLENDLQKYEPDNTILRVNGIRIYGNGIIDNLQLN